MSDIRNGMFGQHKRAKRETRFEDHAEISRNKQRKKDEDEFNKSNRQSYASATKENKEEPSYTNSSPN